ncbi:D-alanyl-D-alanine carboxypeptidase family protein (macronuclear) [Tetrahymena thermophila SB210]|uniref:D-alanyl-D-alanine carboxypeptidase family protein n=1 Tax=Tetrahymena thermophila (strain SB210) TaxID=312017 RepID=Q22XY7_TETTS|nr:D-alanyl-D-alanine carboxypeptidase family protein [Tetrahymena thermophila SB210]EAR90237.2 D-alanyl-D-alanine carboxypeptidase family protein [Tetrahymena thermophila SB210]|eukprot:XP_001010482.2 D-alanyl-D-alanine carboxypeptidase family protein [Tetrahymena thermophila SB210]
MIDQVQSANDFDKKEESNNQDKKEKKLHKRLRTSSANLYSKKCKKQNISPAKGSANQAKVAKLPHQRSLSAKKPALPVIFQEQRINSNSLLPISALCWSVTDAVSGQLIYSKMSSEVREMASLTKMMTLYVCHQLSTTYNLNAESEEIIVPRIAAYTCGTSAFLRENEKLCLQDLYYALMLPSGNDAAVTLAHHFGQLLIKNPLQPIKIRQQLNNSLINQIQIQQQSQQCPQKQTSPERDMSPFKKSMKEDAKLPSENPDLQQNLSSFQQLDQKKKSQQYISRFVKEMNKYAQKLGMRDSQFSNCHGLASKSNRSTCEDLSKVALNIIQTPYLQQICSTKNYQCIIYHTIKKDIRKAEWVNTNKLLWDETNSFKGVKTGCTDNAGPCLCVYYKDPINVNIELIVTVLCCRNPERRFDDSSNLARWAAKQLKSCQAPIQQSTSNQNKFQFYNPSNSNQKNLFSRSNAFQVKNKNEISSEIIPQLEQVHSSEKVYQLGRTINSFTQLTSFCNINTSFIQANNSNTINLNKSMIKAAKNTQKVKKLVSPLLQQSEQNRINKFINSNINQIQNHHFNVNSLYGKDESELTERSIIPQLTNRGNENIQNTNNSQIQRDHSAKLLYNSAEKNMSINLIKKRIEDKTKIENEAKYSKSPTKIQKMISQLNSCKPSTIQNVPQLVISSSQSTSYSSNQTSSTNKNYNDNILSIQSDDNTNNNNNNNNNPNTIMSPTTTKSIQISHQNSEIQNQNFDMSNNPSIIQNSEDTQQDQSQQSSLQQNLNNKQDSHTSQLNILLNERIQYRSEIRDSIKKPIGGGNSINSIQSISQIQNSERASSLINQSLINNLEINKSTNLNNSNANNNNNHNIKIFSKSKKKRYIISCLANIN